MVGKKGFPATARTEDELIAITFPEEVWYGLGNIEKIDQVEAIVF